ncbi:hypothetical protein ACFS07_09005 [Undibacterium arcticum]
MVSIGAGIGVSTERKLKPNDNEKKAGLACLSIEACNQLLGDGSFC